MKVGITRGTVFKLILLVMTLFLTHTSSRGGGVSVSLAPPPVEKNKQLTKQQKRNAKKLHRKQKRQWRKWNRKLKKAKKQNMDGTSLFITLLLLIWLILLAGVIMFGLGWSIVPLWMSAIIMMGTSNVAGLILGFFAIGNTGGEGSVSNATTAAHLLFLLLLLVTNFVGGLVFVLMGALSMTPLVWIVGIALLVMMLIALVAFIMGISEET